MSSAGKYIDKLIFQAFD